MEMREQDGSEEENAGDRGRERNLEREGTISRERRGVKEKNQPDCREERKTEMRERESEGNHREDCKKDPNYHFLILQLHFYGKTPGKKKIVNPKREKITARKEEEETIKEEEEEEGTSKGEK